jgi:hypothetical protein
VQNTSDNVSSDGSRAESSATGSFTMEYHLEFTQHDQGSPGPGPSRDNLLVLYFNDSGQVGQVGSRLAALGHLPVEAENPYWTDNGAVTVEDPDGWRVVLMPNQSAG